MRESAVVIVTAYITYLYGLPGVKQSLDFLNKLINNKQVV